MSENASTQEELLAERDALLEAIASEREEHDAEQQDDAQASRALEDAPPRQRHPLTIYDDDEAEDDDEEGAVPTSWSETPSFVAPRDDVRPAFVADPNASQADNWARFLDAAREAE